MKPFALLSLLVCITCGCVSHKYTVILRNGEAIPASNRPRVDKATAVYHFKDKAGKPVAISAYDIQEIEVR
jgi:Bacterial protein of unknown function (DUF903)